MSGWPEIRSLPPEGGECTACAEYHLTRVDALLMTGLVGPGCPWESVQQMADDLGKAQVFYQYAERHRLARFHGVQPPEFHRLCAAVEVLSDVDTDYSSGEGS